MKKLTRYLLLAGLSACATSAYESMPLNYTYRDNTASKRIDLFYKNTSKEDVCLDPGQWPNKLGKIDAPSGYVFIIVDGIRYPMNDYNYGYCIGNCQTNIRPGEQSDRYLSYSDFNLPLELYEAKKQLEFPAKTTECVS